jgi:arginine/ornithine transport system substrate-binding protein
LYENNGSRIGCVFTLLFNTEVPSQSQRISCLTHCLFLSFFLEFSMRRQIFTASLILSGLMLSLGAQAQTVGKLRIGVEGNYPPFSQLGADGKLSGFDIDIANAVCAQLKMECQLVQQEWDGMMPALSAKKFDLIVASMTITDERKKVADFSDAYYDVPQRFLAKTGAFKDYTPASLKGKKIIVLRNSPRAKFIADTYKESEVHLVNKEAEVYLELAAGRGDIALGSSVASGEFMKKPEGKGYATVGNTFNLGAGAGVGIALRKGEDDLRNKVNAALKTIKTSGQYKTMAVKYFDFDISGDGSAK